jgi:hypothetical protein
VLGSLLVTLEISKILLFTLIDKPPTVTESDHLYI